MVGSSQSNGMGRVSVVWRGMTAGAARAGRPCWCAAIALALSVAPVRTEAQAVRTEAQAARTLDDVAVLTGCWAGEMGPLTLEEQWGAASGAVMLATTRFIREGLVVDWEFARMVEDSAGVTLWPYPRGTISEHGFPLVSTDGALVFENLEHDFPVRIIYEVVSDDELRPRIEGTDGQGPSWWIQRVPCPGPRHP